MPGPPPEVLKRPDNRRCADCDARDPRWASVNLGIFICETCAGVHRDLGTHISKVKSVKLDEWKPELVERARAIGNKRSNAYYEYNVPDGVKYVGNINSAGGDKIDEGEAKKLKVWIRAKYEAKKFAPPGVDEPWQRVARGESLDDAGPAPPRAAPPTPNGDAGAGDPEERPRRSKSSSKERRGRKAERDDIGARGAEASAPSPGPDGFFPDAFAPLGDWANDPEGRLQKKHHRSKSPRRRHSAEAALPTSAPGGLDAGLPQLAAPWGAAGAEGAAPPQMTARWGVETDGAAQHWGAAEAGGAQPAPATAHVQMQMPMQMHQPDPGVANANAHGWQHGDRGQVGEYYHYATAFQGPSDGERKAALQSVARLFHDPHSLGMAVVGQELLPLFGFDLMAAEFHPTALKKRKEGGGGLSSRPGTHKSSADDWLDAVSEPLSLDRFRGAGAGAAAAGAGGGGGFGDFFGGSSPYEANVAEGARNALISAGYGRSSSGTSLPGVTRRRPPESLTQSTGDLTPILKAAVGSELGPVQAELRRLQAQLQSLQQAMGSNYERLKEDRDKASFDATGAAATLAAAAATVAAAAAATASPKRARSRAREASPASSATDRNGSGSHRDQPRRPRKPANWPFKHEEPTDWWLRGTTPGAATVQSGSPVEAAPAQWAQPGTAEGGAAALSLPSTGQAAHSSPSFVAPSSVSQVSSPSRSMFPGLPTAAGSAAAAVISREAFDCYARLFRERDLDRDGCLSGAEVRDVLERSGLDAIDLGMIWALCNVRRNGRMTLEEFACAMHLVTQRQQGAELPLALSQDLLRMASELAGVGTEAPQPPGSGAAGSPWEVAPEEAERYCSIFATLDPQGRGALTAEEAWAVLEAMNLPVTALNKIWQLSDVDGDTRLTRGELACALHLANRAVQGHPLPDQLPPELVAACTTIENTPPGSIPATASRSPTPAAVAAKPQEAAGASSPGPSPWAVDEAQVLQYLEVWEGLGHADPAYLSAQEAKEVMSRSGLPDAELSHVWQLSDRDGDGRLSFEEFMRAAHLISRRRQGWDLPQELPSELVVLPAAPPAAFRPPPPPPPPPLQPFVEAPQASDVGSRVVWAVTPAELEAYREVFRVAAAAGGTGGPTPSALGAQEAKELLERSGLPIPELAQIWRLADVDSDGLLAFGEFACAMRLVTRRREGVPLPTVLPPELAQLAVDRSLAAAPAAAAAAAEATAQWAVTPVQLEAYEALFMELLPPGASVLEAEQAREVLERSFLPRHDLAQVWRLADLDGDGCLTLPEFVCAVHLANRRREGIELPEALPPPLLTAAASLLGRPRSPSVGSRAGGGGGGGDSPRGSPWALGADELQRYREIFEGVDRRSPDALSAEEARDFLDRSQLPHTDLSQIWRLSDADGDGRLDFGEFACALHLVALRLRGQDLPEEVPAELWASLRTRGGARRGSSPSRGLAAAVASTGHGGEASFWRPAPDLLETYRSLFEGEERADPMYLSSQEAREVLERSGLPPSDLSRVWRLSDVDGDGRLSLPEFACAMHLVAGRRGGLELPSRLPPELAASTGLAAAGGA